MHPHQELYNAAYIVTTIICLFTVPPLGVVLLIIGLI